MKNSRYTLLRIKILIIDKVIDIIDRMHYIIYNIGKDIDRCLDNMFDLAVRTQRKLKEKEDVASNNK